MRLWLWLILSQANISICILSWNYGEHSDVIVGKILLSFSFEISLSNLDSLFDLMGAGLHPNSWVKLFSIAHGLTFIYFSGSIFYVTCVGYN